jgi:hypothetical protein
MAKTTPRDEGGSSGDGAPAMEKGPVEARQGFRGSHVLYILLASLALAAIAYLAIHYYFFGSVI